MSCFPDGEKQVFALVALLGRLRRVSQIGFIMLTDETARPKKSMKIAYL